VTTGGPSAALALIGDRHNATRPPTPDIHRNDRRPVSSLIASDARTTISGVVDKSNAPHWGGVLVTYDGGKPLLATVGGRVSRTTGARPGVAAPMATVGLFLLALGTPAEARASDGCATVGTACIHDVDCAADTRCVAGAPVSCPDGAPTCTGTATCVVKWQGPCRPGTDDCGSGFVCTETGGSRCDCSGDAEAGDEEATVLPCGEVSEPPVCEAGGACVATPAPCDGGFCVCENEGVCVAQRDFVCVDGGGCPDDWSCNPLGSCDPPCLGSTDAGQAHLYPPAGASGAPGYAVAPASCHCELAARAGRPGRSVWWALGPLVALAAARRRRRR
jgi:hypothetical protein